VLSSFRGIEVRMLRRVAACTLALSATMFASVWHEKVLYSFQGPPDGAVPAGAMAFDKAGNLYGVTTLGGVGPCAPTQCGTVFQLQPPATKGGAWTEQVLHIFGGHAKGDGNTPAGGVIFDAAGNLYGTTAYGGTGNCVVLGSKSGCGTVFVMKPPATKGGKWTENVLYSFKSGKDGYLPNGDLVFDHAGNLYGATEFGGGFGSCDAPFYQFCGTIFELSPPKVKSGKWTEKVLYHFKSGKDGANPNGGLVLDGVGNIYGTTYVGGSTTLCVFTGFVGCGTVFKLGKPGNPSGVWRERVLYAFTGLPSDGLHPVAGLARRSNGNLYGTTLGGGTQEDGVIFQLIPPTKGGTQWNETLIHNFSGGSDGGSTLTGLVPDFSGNFYGTSGGGASRGGLLFRLNTSAANTDVATWNLSVLYNFTGSPDGYSPVSLVRAGTGVLYGATLYGGTGQACRGGCGAVFQAKP